MGGGHVVPHPSEGQVKCKRAFLLADTRHTRYLAVHKILFEGRYEDNRPLSPKPLGGLLNPMAVPRAWNGLAKHMGLTNVILHNLRYFQIWVILQEGQSLGLASKRLGNASMVTTRVIYAHLLPG